MSGSNPMDGEPSIEELADDELRRIKTVCRMIAMGQTDDLEGVMLVVADQTGTQTFPYIAPENDARQTSIWLLGAMLWHMDKSTPEGTHPLEIADHALAMNEEYLDDPHVGWSTEKSVSGEPWEGGD